MHAPCHHARATHTPQVAYEKTYSSRAHARQSAYLESFGWDVERRVELPKYMFDEVRDLA